MKNITEIQKDVEKIADVISHGTSVENKLSRLSGDETLKNLALLFINLPFHDEELAKHLDGNEQVGALPILRRLRGSFSHSIKYFFSVMDYTP